jgi:hypothetical protein
MEVIFMEDDAQEKLQKNLECYSVGWLIRVSKELVDLSVCRARTVEGFAREELRLAGIPAFRFILPCFDGRIEPRREKNLTDATICGYMQFTADGQTALFLRELDNWCIHFLRNVPDNELLAAGLTRDPEDSVYHAHTLDQLEFVGTMLRKHFGEPLPPTFQHLEPSCSGRMFMIGSALMFGGDFSYYSARGRDIMFERIDKTAARPSLLRVMLLRFKDIYDHRVPAVLNELRLLPTRFPQICSFEGGIVEPWDIKANQEFGYQYILGFASTPEREDFLEHPEYRAFLQRLMPLLDGYYFGDSPVRGHIAS